LEVALWCGPAAMIPRATHDANLVGGRERLLRTRIELTLVIRGAMAIDPRGVYNIADILVYNHERAPNTAGSWHLQESVGA
jgi:hypothetical protein